LWYQNEIIMSKEQKAFTWRPDDQTFNAAKDMAEEENLSINQYVTKAVKHQAAMDIIKYATKKLKSKTTKTK
jgi:hypothetical protein